MLKRKLTIWLALLLSICTGGYAQNNNAVGASVASSPNAAAVGRYGDAPVNLHTGTSSVGLPIYTLSHNGGLSAAVSLSYHAGGVRVADIATPVGLGWSLAAGGSITRTVRNAPDEGVRSANGSGKGWYLTPITEIQQGFNLNTAHSNDHQNAMSNGMWDTEPDVFQYDLPGYSGKFYFKHDGTAPPIPVFLNKTQDIKIETHFIGDGSTRAGTFDYWVITTPDGTRYYFGTPRTNDDDIFTDVATELTCSYSASTGAELKNVYVSAWNLTKIETPDRNHNIQFKYERETYRYTNRGSDHVAGQTYVTDVDREINSEVLGSRLAEIISDFEKITFIRGSNNRRDLDQWVHVGMSLVLPNTTQNMAKPLSKIVVQSTVDNQTIRTFNLNQGYLESSAVGYPNDNATNNLTHSDKYRLYLKSVDEYGNTMSEETKRTHTYSYIGVGTTLTSDGTVLVALPRRKSAASDIWGFYNGKDANKYLNAIVDLYSGNIADYGTANRIDQNVSFGDIGIEMTKQFNTSLGTFFNNNPSYWIEQYQNLVYNGNPAYVNNAFNNPLKVFAYLNSDRTPSAQHMSIGALNKVTYPMGSVTEYEFEPHTYLGKTAKFKFVRPMYQFISGGDAGNTRYNEGIIYSHPPLYFPRPNNPDVDDIPIRIKNAHIEVVNPELFNTNVNSIPGILNASRLVYSLSLENKNDNYQTVGMEFRVRIKKGSVIKEKIYLLQPGEQKKVFLEKFIGNIWDGTLEEFQNAEIQIFGNNHGSNKCMISFLVFYNTVGIETEDKLMGGLRIKSIKTKESENATPIVANYNYKQELQQYTSGIMPVMPRLIYNMRYAAHGPENFYVTMVQNANSPTNPVLSIYNEAIRFDIKPGNLFGASSNNQSGGIGYKEVKVSKPGQGFTRYYYHMDQPEENKPIPYPEVPEYSISGKNGLLMRSVSYNEVGARVHEINYNYTEERPAPPYYGTNFIEGYNFTKPMHQRITKYRIDLGYRVYLSSKTEWIDGIESTVRYRYDPLWRHHLPIETTMRNSDEKTYKTKTTYAGNDDFVDWQWFNKHMLHLPLKTEVYVNNELLAEAEPIFSGDEIAGLKRIVSSRSKLHKGTNPQWITAGTIEYNANGLPKKVTERAATVSTEFVWDAQRRLSSVTHAGQFSTNYHYLQNTTQVKEVTNYLGQKVKYYYDDFGQVNKTEGAFTPGTDDANVRQEYSYKFKSPTTPDHYTETSMWTSDLSEIVGSTGNTVVKTRQYLDGFGRVKGAIQEGYTPDQKNLSSAVTYDALGRLDKVFEPFERTTGGYAPAPVATPFVTAEYEASPLGRTLKRVNPDQTTVQVAHGSNTAADAIAQYALDQATGTVTVVGTYPASTLYKVVSTDENGKKSAAFTDKIGRTIMTRRYGANNETLDTYVAYDKYGNAVAVIPPFDAGEQVNKLSYFYEYDNRNRLTRKKIPNTDWVNFHYDNRDFLVMTQDGNMRAENPNKYVYAQYDELGRPVAAGFVIATNPNDETANRNRAISPDDLLSTVTYRADANLVEKTATRILGATGGNNVEWITTAYTYDTYWRLVSTNSNNHLEHDTHAEVTNMAPKFHGLPDATSRTHKGYKNVDINHHFAFDHSGRLLNVQHEAVIDGESMGWQNLSALQYNYKDQVTVKHLSFHNSTGKWLQDIDYQYNVRGWLTAINPFDVSAQQVNACNQLLMSSNDDEPKYCDQCRTGSGKRRPFSPRDSVCQSDPISRVGGHPPVWWQYQPDGLAGEGSGTAGVQLPIRQLRPHDQCDVF